MSELSAKGLYKVPASVHSENSRLFAGGMCSEEYTMKTIAATFNDHSYLIDTHTAVALKVLTDYRAESGDNTPAVVVSTASPFKFCDSVLMALGRQVSGGGVGLIDALEEATGCTVPAPLATIRSMTPRFFDSVSPGGMRDSVLKFLTPASQTRLSQR
jgi:threonine synthase